MLVNLTLWRIVNSSPESMNDLYSDPCWPRQLAHVQEIVGDDGANVQLAAGDVGVDNTRVKRL